MNRSCRRILALLDLARCPLTGLEMSKATGLGPARLYPALARLTHDGLIVRMKDVEPMEGTQLHRFRYAVPVKEHS